MSKQKFNIGDKVIITRGCYKDVTGTVETEISYNSRKYYQVLLCNEVDKIWCYSYELEPYKENSAEELIDKKSPFKNVITVTRDNFYELAKKIIDNKLYGNFVTDEGAWYSATPEEFGINMLGVFVLNGIYISNDGTMPGIGSKIIKWIPDDYFPKDKKQAFNIELSFNDAREIFIMGQRLIELSMAAYPQLGINFLKTK